MTHPEHPVALVTGASAGIGLEMARVLAEKKHDLILVARREDRLRELKQELETRHGVGVTLIAQDLARDGSAQELHRKIRTSFQHIDVLINNAGFGVVGEFLHNAPEKLDEMIRLNVLSLTLLTRLFGEDMRRSGHGRILQVASIGAYQPCPYFASYSATKAYVLSFGLALHEEFKAYGVTVTTLCPGNTITEFMDVAGVRRNKVTTSGAMTARAVAEQGLAALFSGCAHITTGTLNKINGALVMHLPRTWASKIAGSISRKFMMGKAE